MLNVEYPLLVSAYTHEYVSGWYETFQ